MYLEVAGQYLSRTGVGVPCHRCFHHEAQQTDRLDFTPVTSIGVTATEETTLKSSVIRGLMGFMLHK
ncbi:hypothetical protein ILYODFUR_009594 [Ilyodon furcidens]|uniref:Uncharacterized protein n=1 Tax=Ilyodon furcidens TaxID=33524 RepID=A0ABV0U703_9TELE